MLCVFDCETIPDVELVRSQFDIKSESDLDASIEAQKAYEEKKKTTFLPIPFHKVVAISAVIGDEFGVFKKVSSIEGENEKEMIENFIKFINVKNPKLVSFNGRGFDMPMLMVRAMKYNIQAPAYFEVDNRSLNKSKWENYRTRYSDKFHIDLQDHISEFGAVRGMNLNLLCQMMGIPGKFDVSGDQVMELYYQNEIDKIKEYCESDVLNTYWLYLKYELLRGNITHNDYNNNLSLMAEGIDDEKSYSGIFKESIC